jgi:hypothetical protein
MIIDIFLYVPCVIVLVMIGLILMQMRISAELNAARIKIATRRAFILSQDDTEQNKTIAALRQELSATINSRSDLFHYIVKIEKIIADTKH